MVEARNNPVSMVEARNNLIFADGRMAVLCEATISICSMRIFQGKTKIYIYILYIAHRLLIHPLISCTNVNC